MRTVSAALLDPFLSRDPVGPRITYYDDASGERIELSTVTLLNWAAKTANLLRDELGAGPDSRISVLLPAHWQTAAVLLGIWYIGAEVVIGPGEADIALCTAERFADAEAAVGPGEIAVLSLDPFGKPVADLPVGVTDYATSVRVHGDQVVPEPQPGPALDGRSADELLAAAADSAAARVSRPPTGCCRPRDGTPPTKSSPISSRYSPPVLHWCRSPTRIPRCWIGAVKSRR